MDTTPSLRYRVVPSPVGRLLLVGTADALHVLSFVRDGRFRSDPDWNPDDDGVLDGVAAELDEYFAGRLRRFETPVTPSGTPFQTRVWRALRDIPYGETTSYGELARRIGSPAAVRAVGAANGANPIAIIIPCHRVIGANGSLTGFGGGLPTKRALLDLEQGLRRLI